ncbi:6826_t:CDS:2 [Funneliformis geosporum]|uniref:6826_t:CDS:1 n=1 Tax=Funneliformis geosporum TaxID=1117311 RepID=A0A9W4SBS3_9GLOM|nr:6826_t:CDS:2 [Funneliformis geosporum]
MSKKPDKKVRQQTRKERSKLIKGTSERPRVVLSESNRYLRVQAIDDTIGNTLLSSSTVDFIEKNENYSRKNKDYAKKLGQMFAEKLKKEGKEKIVFDQTSNQVPTTDKNNPERIKLGAERKTNYSTTKEPKNFEREILKTYRPVKVTKGGRQFSSASLVLIKDIDKKSISYAHEGGKETMTAFRKSFQKAQKKLIAYFPNQPRTIPRDIEIKYNATKLILKPTPPGSGIKAGEVLSKIFKYLGIKDVSAKIIGSRNKLNVIRAAFLALDELTVLGRGKVVIRRTLTPKIVGSIPAVPAKKKI